MTGLNAEDLLSSSVRMDAFIHRLATYKITNCTGSAYRKVRLCYYEDGILLVSDHHTNHFCRIRIATDPKASIVRGCQESRAHGNPNPKPDRGELVSVWNEGHWINRGPWEAPIRALLSRLLVRVAKAEKTAGQASERRSREQNADRARQAAELVGAWSEEAK